MSAATTTSDPPRRGDWMITVSGRRFWPLDPRPAEVHWPDIAHALSQTCRYGGHTRKFYSVAEHSVHMANHFHVRGESTLALWALLHDAAEAYFADIIRPVKPALPDLRRIEDAIALAIFQRAGLVPMAAREARLPEAVHAADTAILGDEAMALFGSGALASAGWTPPAPLGVVIAGWRPTEVRPAWLGMLRLLAPHLAGEIGRTA